MSAPGWAHPHAVTEAHPIPAELTRDGLCARPPARLYQWVPDAETPAALEPLIRTCLACPVRVACLDYALTAQVTGVWGGTSSTQRARFTGHAQPGRPRRR